jgi:predicted dehydrogenase
MLRLMLLGCGLRGRTWARVVKANPDCEVAAYVDINPEALVRVKKEYDSGEVPGFTDYAEAVENVDVDAAVIVTPPQFHHEQAVALLEERLHLLVEKPLTEDFGTSLEIVKLAERRGLNLTVGMQFRYMPVTLAYRKLFEEGGFGRPSFSQFSYIRTRNPMNYKGWVLNQYCNDMAHTFLLEQAIHHLDLIRFVYSTDVEWIQAHEWNPVDWEFNPYRQDPNVSILMSLKNGMHVNYIGTWISGNTGMNEGIDFRWRTDHERGIIVQKTLFGEDGIYKAHRDDPGLTHVETGPIEPFYTDTVGLLDEFVCCLESGRPPETSGRDHLKTLSVVLASIESSVTGERVYMDEFMEGLGFPRELVS